MADWIEGRVRGAAVSLENILSASTPVPEAGCWIWEKAANRSGYGIVSQFGRVEIAHRVSYALANGAIPAGAVVMHKCDTPLCVNPQHLSVGSRGDNNRDRSSKGRDFQKVSAAQAAAIKADPRTQAVIAADYGIHQSTVNNIKSGKRRSDAIRKLGDIQ